MATSTPNMGLTRPDPQGSIGTWSAELNASLDVADAHDHSTGNGVKVPTAGLNINADLSFAGFGATGLRAVDLAAVLASEVTGYPTALFCNSADNELYWRTSGGVNVQLTSGTSLNAALLGGFTGDYGSGGSTVSFTSGTSIYNFLRAANHRAFIDCSDIRLFQGSVGIANSVKLRSPNALAASYDWVFPTVLPGAQTLLQITSGGQVTPANTGVQGITLAAGTHATVSGAGRYKHGSIPHVVGGGSCYSGAGVSVNTTNGGAELSATTDRAFYDAPAHVGKRLVSVRVRCTDNATGATQVQLELFSGGDSLAATGAAANSAGTGAAQTLTITPGSPITLAAGTRLVLRGNVTANNLCTIHWVEWTFDEV